MYAFHLTNGNTVCFDCAYAQFNPRTNDGIRIDDIAQAHELRLDDEDRILCHDCGKRLDVITTPFHV
jgi:hypothetical protein